MKYVRWKRYGFTHIMLDNPPTHRWGGPTTLCGNSATHYRSFRLGWVSVTEKKQGLKTGDLDPRLLAPSEKDDKKRPLCGTCKKAAEKIRRKAATA